MDRAKLKNAAKQNIKKNYWICVIAAFLAGIGALGSVSSSGANYAKNQSVQVGRGAQDIVSNIVNHLQNNTKVLLAVLFGIAAVGVIGTIISIVIKLLVVYQIEVGAKGFFVKNTYSKANLGEVISTYQNGSMGTVALTRFLMDVFLTLWTFLFIIPRFIKGYQYKMIPYILAENPDIEWREAFALSKEMTDGHKMELFVLDLSFIGWLILSALTFGIASLFYVSPYYEQTMAEMYNSLK